MIIIVIIIIIIIIIIKLYINLFKVLEPMRANRTLYTLVLLYFLYENKGVDGAGSNELLS